MHTDPAHPGLPPAERKLIAAARSDAQAAATTSEIAAGLPAEGIPGYEILHEIHRGGQGVVYRAHQKSAGRTVAIKVMRDGPFAGPLDRARFEREVRILGALRHPNIVAIHDSGQAHGHFFYVMDYIPGHSLEEYLQEHKTGLRARLALFLKICDAVNAAHLRGIVHRDLKPGNIRVDGAGEPYILDFGLARGAGGGIGDSAPQVMTVTGQFIGSLQWASPEQTEGVPDRVDMRTDVYSLGVILYQMLTGRFPYDVASEMWIVVEQIRRAEPVRPRSICKDVDDDLETILLRCLQKDRERRYQTAGELARDLRHYLAGEAIEAKRDSTWYVLRKALRRHRAAVLGAALTFVGLLVVAIVSTAMYRTAERERQRASDEASKSRRTIALLRDVFAFIDPDRSQGRDTSLLREALDDAASRIGVQLERHPELAAALHLDIGDLYLQLGYYAQAQKHGDTAWTLLQDCSKSQSAEATSALRFLALCHWRQNTPYAQVQSELEDVLARRKRLAPEGSAEVAESLHDLARLKYDQNDYDGAARLHDEAIRMVDGLATPTEALRAAILLDAARVAIMRADYTAADALLERLSRTLDQSGTEANLAIADLLYTQAISLWRAGSLTHIAPLLERALSIQQRLLPEADHPLLARTRDLLGLYLFEKESTTRGAEGLEHLAQAYAIRRARLQGDSDDLADSLEHYGSALIASNQPDNVTQGEELIGQAIDIRSKLYGPDSSQVADLQRLLYQIPKNRKDYAEAIRRLEAALETLKRSDRPDPEVQAKCLYDLGCIRMYTKEWGLAEEALTRVIDIRRERSGGRPTEALAEGLRQLAQVKREQKKFDDAVQLLEESLTMHRDVYSPQHPNIPIVINTLARTLIAAQRYDEAEKAIREAVQLCEAHAACEAGRRWQFRLTLGTALLRQKRLDEAEPILKDAHAGLVEAYGAEHSAAMDASAKLDELVRERQTLSAVPPQGR